MARQKRKISNLLPNTRYAVRVRSYNGLGTASDWSEAYVVQTLGIGGVTTTPNPPTSLVINYSSPTLILSWSPATSNTDGTPLVDFQDYEVILTAGLTSVVYTTTTASFSYGMDSNIHDFGTAQGTFTVSVRTVNNAGNKSSPLTGTANNGLPTTPTVAPILTASFTIISITMTSNDLDWGGFLLQTSTDNITYTTLATVTGKDTYIQQVTAGTTHYYRYKAIDKFGNQSAGYSPVQSITTHLPLVIDGYQVIDNLAIQSNLVVNGTGQIQSFNYPSGSGYTLTASGATFQNGGISILGLGGFLSMDSTSLRAVYSGITQLLVNSTGVFIGGTTSATAEIYVDTAAQKTYIQGNTIFKSTGGNYTFSIDLSSQTTGSKVLRLYDSFNNDTFYLTNDGSAFFAKGSIGLGGSGAFHVDNSGNLWLGNSVFGSAPFSVSAAGALTATSASITGSITGSSTITIGSGNNVFKADSNGIYLGNATFASAPFRVTMAGALTATSATIGGVLTASTISGWLTTGSGGGFQTGTSGQRIEISSAAANTIKLWTGYSGETAPGQLYASLNTLKLDGPNLSWGFPSMTMTSSNVMGNTSFDFNATVINLSSVTITRIGSSECQISGFTSDSSGRTIRDSGGGWVRTFGQTGLFCSDYGGGIYMTDSTSVRTYGGKSFYSSGGSFYVKASGDNSHRYFYDSGMDGGILEGFGGVIIRNFGNDMGEVIGDGASTVRTVNFNNSVFREHQAIIHTNVSDISQKNIIAEAEHFPNVHHREIVRSIGRPFQFRFKDEEQSNTKWGFDANVLPKEFISDGILNDGKGGKKTVKLVDPQSMISVLYGALTELIEEYDELKNRVQVLEKK